MAEYIEKEEVLLQLTGLNLPKDRDDYIALINKRIQNIQPIGKWCENGCDFCEHTKECMP